MSQENNGMRDEVIDPANHIFYKPVDTEPSPFHIDTRLSGSAQAKQDSMYPARVRVDTVQATPDFPVQAVSAAANLLAPEL